jgi:NAD(P)-dependent dehydrogenase (short-subunit alcohol dehydrogenase family)
VTAARAGEWPPDAPPGPGAWVAPDLRGAVAMVTGASRGVGRGVALVLAECGATVYVTGRSPSGGAAKQVFMWTGEVKAISETLEETAALATERGAPRGGRAVALYVDHTRDDEVEGLFAQVERECGRLDVLVNNVWGGYENMEAFGRPFWEQPAWRWDAMLDAGARAHFIASRLAVPLMLPRRRGLIVGTSVAWPAERYDGRLVYYVAKQTVNRLTWAMAEELREHGIAALAISPVGFKDGWVSSGEELQSVYAALETPGGIDALHRTNPRLC